MTQTTLTTLTIHLSPDCNDHAAAQTLSSLGFQPDPLQVKWTSKSLPSLTKAEAEAFIHDLRLELERISVRPTTLRIEQTITQSNR